jgi:hypothetical protein
MMSILRNGSIFSAIKLKTLQHEELAEADEEDTDNICFADLWDQIEALEERVKVQGMHIQQVKLETDEEGMGDHMIFPMAKNFCS